MEKMRLQLDELAVQSFATTPQDSTPRGTVHGNQESGACTVEYWGYTCWEGCQWESGAQNSCDNNSCACPSADCGGSDGCGPTTTLGVTYLVSCCDTDRCY